MLALRYSIQSPHPTTGPRHFRVTTGRPGCWSKGNAAASAGAAGPFYGTTGRRKQQVAAAELSVPQIFPRTTGRPGAADAAVDSAGAAVPSEELRAGTHPPDGYARVHRGKRTTPPRDLHGARKWGLLILVI